MNLRLISLYFVMGASSALNAQTRNVISLKQWEFSRDSIHWEKVSIPHDWAISGPFDKKWDLQNVAIVQNGEKTATEKSGRSGALPWIGEGWYRTTLNIDNQLPFHQLQFDGAMSEPTVYINKEKAGYWAYGYNAFRIDASTYLHKGKNEVVVHLKNREESSRWYPGAGLYRPVTVASLPKLHFDEWGLSVRTDSIGRYRTNGGGWSDEEVAFFNVNFKIENPENEDYRTYICLKDDNGKIQNAATDVPAKNVADHYNFFVSKPHLWSPEDPYRYTLELQLLGKDGKVVDKLIKKVGLRTIKVDSINGFQLNGKSRRIKGVCLHHDLGPLGAAINKAALIRQVKLMKDMGADAIRTSHNMPSQMQMEVYDSLGMMVMAESFDMWIYPKCKNGYARNFKEWADKDITNLILANRNHPSLVMWSIGNEIPEQWSEEGRKIAERLQNLCHTLDPLTPVTQGMDRAESALKSGFAQTMDVPGFNYRVYKYPRNIKQLPKAFLLGSETASTVSSRGVYKFPLEWNNSKTYPDGQLSSYDTQWCSWSNLPEEDFIAEDDAPYYIGQFIWTGIDYLGEPTPYDEYWPSRSSYFGAVDLAGLPKDRYYLYRSKWNTQEHTLHLLPHWTWPDRIGKVTPVFCYTDYPSAELFVNGKSQGRISKQKVENDGEIFCGKAAKPADAERRAARYRLMWKDVKYEPGELKVVAYDSQGNKAGEQVVKTAGKPNAIKMEADRSSLKADGEDLVYITISIIDKNGVEVPSADDALSFEVKGAGSFKAVCNGDATSLESFTQPTMKLFSGKLVVTLQAKDSPGTLQMVVKDKTNKKLKGTFTIPVK